MPTAPRGFTLVVNIDHVISMIKKAINNAKLLLIFLISYLTIPCQHPLDLREGQENLQPTIEYRNITGITSLRRSIVSHNMISGLSDYCRDFIVFIEMKCKGKRYFEPVSLRNV